MEVKEDDKLIAQTIKMLREKKGLSQAQFSLNCEKSRQQMHEWEEGTKSPSQDNLFTMVTQLGMTRSEFFKIVESAEAKRYAFKPKKGKRNNSALL